MTTAIVTGTSSGIGLHTAVQLAGTGLRVIATVRDTSRADALRAAADAAGVTLDVRALDVTGATGAAAPSARWSSSATPTCRPSWRPTTSPSRA